jgi:hypothetical protein
MAKLYQARPAASTHPDVPIMSTTSPTATPRKTTMTRQGFNDMRQLVSEYADDPEYTPSCHEFVVISGMMNEFTRVMKHEEFGLLGLTKLEAETVEAKCIRLDREWELRSQARFQETVQKGEELVRKSRRMRLQLMALVGMSVGVVVLSSILGLW